jgi:alpha-ketoglutarate-dependent taurine dioxygenase
MLEVDMSQKKWIEAKTEMRELLVQRAKRGPNDPQSLISYSELVGQVSAMSLAPDSHELAEMLREIAMAENEDDRGMLSVLVVHKDGDRLPGPGFFDLARQLGRRVTDPTQFWIEELKKVYAAWASKSGPH